MKIIKEKRKSITLKIDKNGEIILKAPKLVSNKFIEQFLQKHNDWILKQKLNIEKNKISFKIGGKFLFFGEYFTLFYKENSKFYFDEKNFFIGTFDEEIIKQNFIKFYKKEAKKYISKRILEFCNILNLDFNSLKITSASTRWGSCTSKKNINFSYKLILAPKNSVDYVIVHELAHLKEMNHSQNFWNLVEKYSQILGIGSYKENQKGLRKNNAVTIF